MVRLVAEGPQERGENVALRSTLRRFTGLKRKMFSVHDQEIIIQMYYGTKTPTEEHRKHPLLD